VDARRPLHRGVNDSEGKKIPGQEHCRIFLHHKSF
jgi:hypothetical protein